MAQQREPNRRNKQLVIGNFKGMETVIDSSALGLDVADMARNVSWDPDGGISRREGSREIYDARSDVNFFIKKSIGIIDGTDVPGIGAAAQRIAGNKLDTHIVPVKAVEGLKGAKTFVVFPKITSGSTSYYEGMIKNKTYHEPTSGPIVINTSDMFRDSKGRNLSFSIPYITQVDNMGELVNAVYHKGYHKMSTHANDKNEFVILNNIFGTHDSISQRGDIYQKIYDRANDETIWMGVEEDNKNNLWSVVRDGSKVSVITPKSRSNIFGYSSTPIGDWNNPGGQLIQGEVGGFKLAKLGGEWVLLFVKQENYIDVLKSINAYGVIRTVKFSDQPFWQNSLMSYTIAPNRDILALFEIHSGNGELIGLKLFRIPHSTEVPEYLLESRSITDHNNINQKNMFQIFKELADSDPGKFLLTMFTTGEGDSYEINLAIVKILNDGRFTHEMYTDYGISENVYKIEHAANDEWKYTSSKKHIDSCTIYGVTPQGAYHPDVILDTFADRLIFKADSKHSFVTDYVPMAIEVPDASNIYRIDFMTSHTDPIELLILDKDKKIIEGLTIQANSNSIYVGDKSWASDGSIKYIVKIGNDNLIKYVQVFESIEDTKGTNIKIKNSIKIGKKKIGQLLDVSVIISETGVLSVLDKNNAELDIYANNQKSKHFKIFSGNFKTQDISWTYINDSIIISTPESAFVVTAMEVTGDKHVIYINTIFDLADKITYSQALESGLNRLSEQPLKIIKEEAELIGPSHDFQDIIIADENKNIALTISPDQDYYVYPQVVIKDETTHYTKTYTWKLKQLNTDDAKWTDITSSDLDVTDPAIPKIHGLTIETEYRLECEVTIKGGTSPVIIKRNVTFNLDSLSGNNVDNSESVAEEIKKCKYVTTLEGRLVFYGNGTRQIYTSEAESPFYFTASEIITGDAFGKSEPILSINSFKDTHVIFTNTTMMSMTRVYPEKAESFWSVLPLDGVVGAVGHDAVTPIENSLAFASDEGVYVIGQISVAEKRVQLIQISTPIQDVVNTFNKDGNRMYNIFAANLEKRLFISFPDKKYMAVYDYNNAENIAQGKWAIWDHMVPKQMLVDDFTLYFTNSLNVSDAHIDKSTIYAKNKRVYLDVHELSGDELYFTDNGGIYEFEYTTKNSALSEPMAYKKIKRISVTADNWIKEDAKYDVTTFADYQKDWEDNVENIIYKNPTVDLTKPVKTRGFLKLGKTMTTWRKSENIKTITNMKAKKGTVISLSIKNHSKGPISIKRIYVEYLHSNIRRFKSN